MRNCVVGSRFILAVMIGLGAIFLQANAIKPLELTSRQHDSVKDFLLHHLGTPSSAEDKTAMYFTAFVDLKGDGRQEAIVYLSGAGWCGSGGCTALVLTPQGSSYRIVTKLTVVQLPIRVLMSKSNGWHDLSVQVKGGGNIRPYEAVLSFNGSTYPRNPTVSPARRLDKIVEGEVVIPTTEQSSPLY